jgi:hypothetical protein
MTNLIRRLRGMTAAGTADYSVDGETWWADDHLQEVLDAYRIDLNRVPLFAQPEHDGGTPLYHDYYAPLGQLEEAASGSAAFAVEDGDGDNVGTASYTPDYVRGLIRFSADQGGTAYYLRARAYNLAAAAAQVWREKMASTAAYYAASVDGQRLDREQWFDHCERMVRRYESEAGVQTVAVSRTDIAS